MTTLDERRDPPPSSPSASPGTRLRVVLLLDVLDGRHDHFLRAYEQIRHQVAAVPGHISDQLCQSLGNSSQWLITSEWSDSGSFMEWVESPSHREMVEPLHGCVRDTTSLRFVITAETPEPAEADARRREAALRAAVPNTSLDPLPAPPLSTGGVVRHAITFTVKPGSEDTVREILADYRSPQSRVDESTRLLRTSLFLHGNRVVRAVEVSGDLGNALRYVASQPEVRAVEEAINPYLEEDRDLTDGKSARAFFARAALPAAHHVREPADGADAHTPHTRYAFLHPVTVADGPAEAERLAALDANAAADPAHPLVASTLFHRGDVLVRVVDVRQDVQHDVRQDARGGARPGLGGSREKVRPGAPVGAAPAGVALGGRPMTAVTDRTAEPADPEPAGT